MKKAYFLPVVVALAVAGIVIFRPRTPDESLAQQGPGRSPTALLRAPSGGKIEKPTKGTQAVPSAAVVPVNPFAQPPTRLALEEARSTAKVFRAAAEGLLPRLRPILDDLFLKYPFTGTKEEFDAIKLKLKNALRETGDPAAIAAIVIWAAGTGYQTEALAQVRAVTLDIVRQDKDLNGWLRSRSISHFLAGTASDGDQALPERLFALDFLGLQTEDLAGLSPTKISPMLYCLDSADLHLLRAGFGLSLQKGETSVYLPLLKLISSYLNVSSEARDAITDLLNPPPQDQTLRLNLMHAIANQQSRILEDPTAFRFLLASLKDTSDPKLSTAAALAFVHSPTLTNGASPQAGEVMATLVEQYRWAKSADAENRAIKQQQYTFLVSIASIDIEGAAGFVKEALLDGSVPTAAKLTMLKRIQNIASGAIEVDHAYQKTAPALTEAISSVLPQLSSVPLFKEAAQACLDSLAACQKR